MLNRGGEVKYNVSTVFVIVGGLVLVSIKVGDTLLAFLLTGLIPGTTISLPAGFMMIVFALLLGFVIHFAMRKHLYPGSPQIKAARKKAKLDAAQAARRESVKKLPVTQKVATVTRRRYAKVRA